MVNEEKKVKTLLEDISLLENYIEDLFAFTPLPLCFVNPNGMVLEVNPAFIKTTGYDEYDVVGQKLSFFVEKDDAENLLKKAMDKELIEGEEMEVKTKKGDSIPVSVFLKSRKEKNGEINGVFFSFLDLTEIKEKEEKIKKSNEKLEEKMEEMEKINRLTIGRETKMVKLKEEIRKLKEKLEQCKNNGG